MPVPAGCQRPTAGRHDPRTATSRSGVRPTTRADAKVHEVMSQEVRYSFEDEDVAHVAQTCRSFRFAASRDERRKRTRRHRARSPILRRTVRCLIRRRALHGSSQPGGLHSQSASRLTEFSGRRSTFAIAPAAPQ